jgi:hypothetical protein
MDVVNGGVVAAMVEPVVHVPIVSRIAASYSSFDVGGSIDSSFPSIPVVVQRQSLHVAANSLSP